MMYKFIIILFLVFSFSALAEWENLPNDLDNGITYLEINKINDIWYIISKDESKVYTSIDLENWDLLYNSNFDLSNSIGDQNNYIREGDNSTFSTFLYTINNTESIEKVMTFDSKIVLSIFRFNGNKYLATAEPPIYTVIRQIDSGFNFLNTYATFDKFSNYSFAFGNNIYLSTQIGLHKLNESNEWQIDYSDENPLSFNKSAISEDYAILYGDDSFIFKHKNEKWKSLSILESLNINKIKAINKTHNEFLAVGSDGNSGILLSIKFESINPKIDIIKDFQDKEFVDFYYEGNEILLLDKNGIIYFNPELLTNVETQISDQVICDLIKIYNINGAFVNSYKNQKLNDITLNSGIYLIQFYCENEVFTDKIIVFE